MAATVSYEVYSLREGNWSLDSVYDDRGLALDEARHLLKRRRQKGVNVVKENYDDETNKSIATPIFHEGAHPSGVPRSASSTSRAVVTLCIIG